MSYCTPACKHTLSPALRQLLSQPDYAGSDYEDMDHAVVCAVEGCSGRAYVTALCQGKPEADCGKYHNHCSECPGLGVCIHDYRNQHCERCGRHFSAGSIRLTNAAVTVEVWTMARTQTAAAVTTAYRRYRHSLRYATANVLPLPRLR